MASADTDRKSFTDDHARNVRRNGQLAVHTGTLTAAIAVHDLADALLALRPALATIVEQAG